ncbi:MAG: DNA polymerase III subunit delta' [Burkholderiales bacterium]
MQALAWHEDAFQRLIATKVTLPHALLVGGPRGIGKLVFARALAQALLCEVAAEHGRSCGACSACAWFESGSHPDYRQIEPESESTDSGDGEKKSSSISVDQIRALPDFINLSSHRGGPKVVVIHPAEMLNVNAANALLKNLEEPPPRTYFMLVTHRPRQLIPTIRSRCQQIALAGPDTAAATAWLTENGVRRPEIALAHVGNAPLLALELDDSGYWGARAAFMRHLTAHDVDIWSAGEAVRDFPLPYAIAWLQKWSYDLVYHRILGTVRYNPDYHEAVARIASHIDLVAAVRFHREMVKLQKIANHPLNARLFIENVLLGYRELVQPRELAA